MTEIEEEAFSGIGAKTVIIPEGCLIIGENAFADAAQLRYVQIPASVLVIEDSAFAGCKSLIVYGKAGSAAERYAQKMGYTFIAQ